MKTNIHRLLLAALIAVGTSLAQAQNSFVPSAMSYQGMLTDDQGSPIAPTSPENRNVEFRIYDVAAGGTPLWGEAQTVTVFKGAFSVILGNGTAIGAPSGPAAFAGVFTNAPSADLYFGITPQGGPEFAPRQKLLASAYALRARTAEQVNATTGTSNFNWVNAANLTVNGHSKITGGNVLEFGVNDAGRTRNTHAGQIGYQVFSNGLDIVGAGPEIAQRRLTLWAEGGTDFKGPISFSGRLGQHVSMNDAFNGFGVQNDGVYLRGFNRVSFFANGTHNDGTANPGAGGTLMATMTIDGFTLNSGKFTGDGSGLTNVPVPSTVNNLSLNGVIEKTGHGPFIRSFGEGHSFGSQDWTTYSRSSRNFAWYLGGNWVTNELDAGGGTRIMTLTGNGLELNTGSLSLPSAAAALNFGARLGQHVNLFGNTFGFGIQGNTLYSRSADNFNWFVGGSHSDTQNDAGGGAHISNWNNGRFEFYRRVVIGANTNSGTAPLEINGSNQTQMYFNIAHFYRTNGGGTGYDNTPALTALSIRASHGVMASDFLATSDLRLKLPEGLSDSAKDLATLGALEVTNYTMKDKTVYRGRAHKKLIAQQVEKVYPQAVSRTTGTVPDIFRMAAAKKGFITLKAADRVDLEKGNTVRLMQGERDITTEVTEMNADGFRIKETVEDGPIFVYGRKVDDLRLVDYEAISMLNVSATQELARQMKAQAAALAAVRKEREALAGEVAALRKSTSQQEQRLAAMEATVQKLARSAAATPAVRPVKLVGK